MEFDEESVILLRREQRGDSVSGLVPVVRCGVARSIRSRRLMGLIRLNYDVHPGRSRTRNLQIPLSSSLYGSFVPLLCVRGRHQCMLESDALPLCYRAVLYDVYRYVIFIQLSIPLYWGNLWVWSVRGERTNALHVVFVSSSYSLYSFMRDYYLAS